MAQGRLHPGVAPTTKGQVPDNNAVGNCLNFPWSDLVELRGASPTLSLSGINRYNTRHCKGIGVLARGTQRGTQVRSTSRIKRAKPTYLEWHRGKLRVSVPVPRSLHAALGTRLKQPLNTVAEVLKGPYVRAFQRRIEDALRGTEMSLLNKEALAIAEAARIAEHPADQEQLADLIAHRAYAIAGPPVADRESSDSGGPSYRYDPQREKQADAFVALARGEAVPLNVHYQSYADQLTTKARTKADDVRAIAYLTKWCSQNGISPTIQNMTKRRAALFVDALPRMANGISPVTVKKYVNRLSCYWKWLEAREYATANVWRGVTVPALIVLDHERERPFTTDEMCKLLGGPATQHMHDLMRIAALSGARLDAIVDLRVGDCETGSFRFKPQKKETSFRAVPIHSALLKIVARRTQGKDASADLFPEWPAPKKAGSQRERSFKASNAFTDYRKTVGVDDVLPGRRRALTNFHSFRRWFITKAEQAGQPESIIASVVGHKRASMTFGVYSAGPSLDQFKACVESVKLPEATAQASPSPPAARTRWGLDYHGE